MRENFPILQRKINGYPLVYLDNAATTPLDPEVFETKKPIKLEHFGNPTSCLLKTSPSPRDQRG